jgi:flagellar hook-associated protein 2
MTRNSNTVKDLYPGLTLDLLKTSASPITIKSQVDLTKATEAIESYVLTYNDIFNSFEDLRTKNEQNPESSGVLTGDSLLRSIMQTLRNSASNQLAGYAGGPYYLTNLGVKTNRDGTLSFDNPDMLRRQFENNPESLRSFFKDQIVSDNTNISPVTYSVADTVPGSYAIVSNGSSVTVGGVATSNSGTKYTVASGNPNGIVIDIPSGTGATSGTLHYGRSFLTLIEEQLTAYTGFNGLIENKIEGNNARLKDLVKKQEALDDKIASLYQRYRNQYSYMESSIASMQETGNMLESAFKQSD